MGKREREGSERELGRGRKKNSTGKTAQTEDERTEKGQVEKASVASETFLPT